MPYETPHLPSRALCLPEDARSYDRMTKDGVWKLLQSETDWVKRQSFLERSGYALRSRYREGWSPSWLGTLRDPTFCEDSIRLIHGNVIDAKRTADGTQVSIKVVNADSPELRILSAFQAVPELREDPANHCVPALAILSDPINPAQALLVMPYLDPFNKPPLETIQEVLDFVEQTLEGLEFMHSQGVAHRDIASLNIMMDSDHLFPNGHHPVRRESTPDALYAAAHTSRLHNSVRYYFIDFGLSSFVDEGEAPLGLGRVGRNKTAPELSDEVPFDMFRVDVYTLGHLYYMEFLTKYYDLEFLEPLVRQMMHPDPSLRPSASDAYQAFRQIFSQKTERYTHWRLRSRQEDACMRVILDTMDVAKAGLHHIQRILGSQ